MSASLSLNISKKGSFDPLMEDVSISCASSYTDNDRGGSSNYHHHTTTTIAQHTVQATRKNEHQRGEHHQQQQHEMKPPPSNSNNNTIDDQNGIISISIDTITNPEEKMEVAAELSALLHKPSAVLDDYIADISHHVDVVVDDDDIDIESNSEHDMASGAEAENGAQVGAAADVGAITVMATLNKESNKHQPTLERVSMMTMKTSMLTTQQTSQPSILMMDIGNEGVEGCDTTKKQHDAVRIVTPTKSIVTNDDNNTITDDGDGDDSFEISIIEVQEEKVAADANQISSSPVHAIVNEDNSKNHQQTSSSSTSANNTTSDKQHQQQQATNNNNHTNANNTTIKQVESKIQPILINTPSHIPLGIDIDMIMPLISYIRPSSPLREYVAVGDILVFIDGKSTAELSHGVLTKMLNGTSIRKNAKKKRNVLGGGEEEEGDGVRKLIFLPRKYGRKLGIRKASEIDLHNEGGHGTNSSSSSGASQIASNKNDGSKPILSKRDSETKFARKSCQGNMDSSSLFIKQESGGSGDSSSKRANSIPLTSSLQQEGGEGNSSDSVREASGHISTVSGSTPLSQQALTANQIQADVNDGIPEEAHAIPASPESNPAVDSSSRNGTTDSPNGSKLQHAFGTPSKVNNKQNAISPSHTDPTFSSTDDDQLNKDSAHQIMDTTTSPCRSNDYESSAISPDIVTPKRTGGSASQILGIVPPPSRYRNKPGEIMGETTNELGFRAGLLQPQLPNSAMCSLNTITTQLSVQTLGVADRAAQALPPKPSQDGQFEETLTTQLTTKVSLDEKKNSTVSNNSQSISPPTLSRSSSEQRMSKSLLTEGQQTFVTCKSMEQTFYTCQSEKSIAEQNPPAAAKSQYERIEEVGLGPSKEKEDSSTELFSVVPTDGNDQVHQSAELPCSSKGPQSSSSAPQSSIDVENLHGKHSEEPSSSQQSSLPVSNHAIIKMKTKLEIVKSQPETSGNEQGQEKKRVKPADHVPPGDIVDEDDRRRLERRNRPAPKFDYVNVDNNGVVGGQNDEVSTIYGGKWNSALHTPGQRLEDNLGYMEEGYLGGYGGVSVTGRSVDTRSIVYGSSSRVGNAPRYYDPNTQSQLQQNPNLLGLANPIAQQYEDDATVRKNRVAEDERERKESILKQMKKQQHCVEGFLVALIVLSVVALVIILVMVLRNK